MYKVVAIAKEVKGKCAAGIKPGDRLTIKGANVLLEESDVICATALAVMYHSIYALKWGAKITFPPFVQCSDPGPPYSPNGGTVIFELKLIEEK